MAEKRDYYEVLGVAKNANADEIKYMGYAKQVLRRSLIRDFRRIGAQQHKDHGDISETL